MANDARLSDLSGNTFSPPDGGNVTLGVRTADSIADLGVSRKVYSSQPRMQPLSTSATLLTLVLGALGALLAIFLKEAVQQALQRRALAWQLFGYVLLWQKQLVRLPPVFALYHKVKEREGKLRASLAGGTAAFAKKLQEQNYSRDAVRKEIREAISSAVKDSQLKSSSGLASLSLLKTAQGLIAQQRRDLLDGKTFISDRDAALLGRAFAFNVVQFRSSLQSLLSSMEALPAVIELDDSIRGEMVAQIVDQMVVHGEDFFESLLRLERGVDRISKLPLWRLTWEVLDTS